MPSPDFKAAARRHYRDARYLLDDRRWPNSDHLAGLAAECGLKAILEGWCGATLTGDFLEWGHPSKKLSFHIDKLWNQFSLMVKGRSGPVLAAMVAGPAPYATWRVHDRYSDGNAITEQIARDHVDGAKEIVEILQQAELTGAVP